MRHSVGLLFLSGALDSRAFFPRVERFVSNRIDPRNATVNPCPSADSRCVTRTSEKGWGGGRSGARALHVLNHGWWRLAVGGWRLAAVAGWRLATGGWWQLVVVGGGWWLVIGGWWQLAMVGSWRLVAAGGWRRLVAVGGWQLVAVGGWRELAVGGSWRLAVGGWWSLGAVLKGGPQQKKKSGPLGTALPLPSALLPWSCPKRTLGGRGGGQTLPPPPPCTVVLS